MENKKKKVFVGVSGGVDSSVSALLLKQQGYDVVGVFIRTWNPDFIEPARIVGRGGCTWKEERRDAMRVCAQLDIPFLECDAEEAYKKNVAEYMIEEYKKGRTPNPDVMCNREVKFGVFWEFAKKHGADYIATGHYAINNYELRINNYELKKGKDPSKDQSYFLWMLTKEDLGHVIFPVGGMDKSEVRKIAEKNGLITSRKKDSQGICFLGPIDLKEFLSHYIESKKGDVLLARQSSSEGGNENGEVIGFHDGAVFFTIGERHGFTITKKSKDDKPYYVVSKDIENNTITVSTSSENSFSSGPRISSPKTLEDLKARPDRSEKELSDFVINIANINWISEIPKENKIYQAQIRYHGEFFECRVEGDIIKFKKDILVASGQSVVVYDKDVCLGGGIVE